MNALEVLELLHVGRQTLLAFCLLNAGSNASSNASSNYSQHCDGLRLTFKVRFSNSICVRLRLVMIANIIYVSRSESIAISKFETLSNLNEVASSKSLESFETVQVSVYRIWALRLEGRA